MLPGLSWHNFAFILLTLLELVYFWWVTGRNKALLLLCLGWLGLHAALAFSGFYLHTEGLPPRIFLALPPTVLTGLIIVWRTPAEVLRKHVQLGPLHYLHIVRIFVEIFFLHGLYLRGYIAKEFTFVGNNIDIIHGILAPLIASLFFTWRLIPQRVLLTWNIVGMLVLFHTISQAILSAPSPFQMLGKEQATVAIFYFPYIWLPALVAPLVLISHFISIKLLSRYSYNS